MLSSVVRLRLCVGRLIDVALIDHVSGQSASLGELSVRYCTAAQETGNKVAAEVKGKKKTKTKTKATSAKKQRDRKKKADKYSGESVMGANGALYATSGANALDEATLRGMMPGRLARLTLSQGISCHGKKPSMQRVLGAASACAGGSVRDGGA